MFRKDEATIREWSEQNVEKCWQLQRDIVDDAWHCLNSGGLLIYSTCTFNTKENEENIRYFLQHYDDMEVVPIAIRPEWNITGSLLEGMCVMRKKRKMEDGRSTRDCPRNAKLNIMTSDFTHQTSDVRLDLSYQQAIAYLRGEALVLPEQTPRGMVEVSFMGHPLGPVKNIGSRANNLYPKEWRIRTTHIPTEYEPILKQL